MCVNHLPSAYNPGMIGFWISGDYLFAGLCLTSNSVQIGSIDSERIMPESYALGIKHKPAHGAERQNKCMCYQQQALTINASLAPHNKLKLLNLLLNCVPRQRHVHLTLHDQPSQTPGTLNMTTAEAGAGLPEEAALLVSIQHQALGT